jgi:hypothetical protein
VLLSAHQNQGGDIMPQTATNLLDISELPEPKRREVRDFVQFLLSKCAEKRKPGAKRFAAVIDKPLTAESLEIPHRTLPAAFQTPIKVNEYVKVSRNEIYDEI